MSADTTLTRLSRRNRPQSKPAGHAVRDAAEDESSVATSTPLEQHAAVSPVVARQGENSSSSSSQGSPAPSPRRPIADAVVAPVGEAPPSPNSGYQGLAARSPPRDVEVREDLSGDLYAALALSRSAHNSPTHSSFSARGGEEMAIMQSVMAMLPADVAPPIRQALRATAAYAESLQQQYADQAVHIFDVQEGLHAQEERSVARTAALEAMFTSDLQTLQTRIEGAEACAAEWARRAQEADERANALGGRVVELEAKLVAEQASNADNFNSAMSAIARLTSRLEHVERDSTGAPAHRPRFPYTPGTAYHSVQQTPSAPRVALGEHHLRTLGGSATLRDDDEQSLHSVQSTRSMLRQTPALQLPPRPRSVLDAPRSSATATVRDTPAPPAVPPFSVSPAAPVQTRACEEAGGSLKEEARVQLAGAVREARDPQLWAMTQTVQARRDLTQQLKAERAELATRTAAAEASLERERQLLREERDEVERSKREHELLVRQTRMDEQERKLAATFLDVKQRELDLARSELAHSVVSRGGGGGSESARSGAPGRSGGNGGNGDGGGGGDSGNDSTAASSSHEGIGAAPAAAPAAAAADAVADEWPGRPDDLPRKGWFDARGHAITRVAVQVRESDLPRTAIVGLSMVPLVNLQRMLPSLIREYADAARQKQRHMWPALIMADDYGCNWFSSTVRAVIHCITSSSSDNYKVKSLASEASELQRQGEALKASDPALLEWFFGRIAKFLELRRPAELAADLVRWVVKPGLPLKDFVYEFSAAANAVLSADRNQDNFVLTALLEICRQQYSVTAAGWAHISADPRSHTTRGMLDTLRGQAELAKYLAAAREDSQPVYPTDLLSYSKGALGGGGTAPLPPRQQLSAAQKEAARRTELAKRQENQICYMIYALQNFAGSTGAARACFNCGADQHSFAHCSQPYSSANWDAAVEKLPWVVKFRPSGPEDFRQLCARAVERAAKGERGKSAQVVYEEQQRRKGIIAAGRGRGGRGYRGGRGDH